MEAESTALRAQARAVRDQALAHIEQTRAYDASLKSLRRPAHAEKLLLCCTLRVAFWLYQVVTYCDKVSQPESTSIPRISQDTRSHGTRIVALNAQYHQHQTDNIVEI